MMGIVLPGILIHDRSWSSNDQARSGTNRLCGPGSGRDDMVAQPQSAVG